jgi:hypothetical protein
MFSSFSPILWQTLEKEIRCALIDIVPFPKNLGKWSLNLGKGLVARDKLSGEDTCHRVASKSSSNLDKANCLITLVGFVEETKGL